jgi:histidine triad (HIT) family protein
MLVDAIDTLTGALGQADVSASPAWSTTESESCKGGADVRRRARLVVMMACPFCRILGGDAAARVVWTSADAIAFLPLNPATRGHSLVVPRQHVPDLWSLDERLGSSLMTAVREVGRAIDQALQPDGMNLISSAGRAASQTVLHVHLHLVPRWHEDRIGDIWPPSEPWSDEELDRIAELIRAAASTSGRHRPGSG